MALGLRSSGPTCWLVSLCVPRASACLTTSRALGALFLDLLHLYHRLRHHHHQQRLKHMVRTISRVCWPFMLWNTVCVVSFRHLKSPPPLQLPPPPPAVMTISGILLPFSSSNKMLHVSSWQYLYCVVITCHTPNLIWQSINAYIDTLYSAGSGRWQQLSTIRYLISHLALAALPHQQPGGYWRWEVISHPCGNTPSNSQPPSPIILT